jgi:hypothetical protein
MRSLFRILRLPNVVLDQGLAITHVFPSLKAIDAGPKIRSSWSTMGRGQQVAPAPSTSPWLRGQGRRSPFGSRQTETTLTGEFAFQARFHRLDAVHQKEKARSEDFFREVQVLAPDWVALGTTKTAVIYGIGNTPVAHNE